jgi:predicted nucleotidyltransferase component of viral defense system
MAKITPIKRNIIDDVVANTGFDYDLMLKDYYVTILLYLLKDVKGIYFKGGTALNKIFLDYARISEDVDYSVTRDVKEVDEEIKKIVEASPFFHAVTHDKRVNKFTRLIAHYKGFDNEEGTVFIDLNGRAELILKPETHKIPHYYPENIPPFSVTTLAKKEMMGEKMAATIGRNKPRDHFDLYMILKHKHDIDLKIVAKKCVKSGDEFDIVKMFNRAKKLKNRWDQDLGPLLVDRITFQEVMKVLAKHFKLKEEKEKRKNL